MSKLVAFRTYERFRSAFENSNIDEYALNFIADTGQLYTHGFYLNSVSFGAESNGGVPLTVAGISKTLSLSSHTHSNYLEKNTNIDIGNYKIVSGNNNLLSYNNGLQLGDTEVPTYIKGAAYRDSYTILDTGNFSITNLTTNGTILSNVALFTYNNTKFLLDYVKRLNTSTVFNSLASYTCLGTTFVDQKYYGFITFYAQEGTLNSPWALLRINITNKLLEYRTSASTTWASASNLDIPLNALNTAGIVAAPTSSTVNKVWKTDSNGNPSWRDESSNTFYNLRFLQVLGTDLMTYNSQEARTIVAGDNITFSCDNNILTIRSKGFTDTWRPIKVNGTQLLDSLITSGDLEFINGSNTTVEWTQDNKLKINAVDTWNAMTGATSSANGTVGYVNAVPPKNGYNTKFLRADGTWSIPAYPTKASWNYDDVYTKKVQAIPIIVGPSTDTTAGTWTGTTDAFSSYVDGLTIIYVPAVAGAATTTLNINGLGAKTCYYTNTSKLTTHFAVGTPIMFTYYGGYWKRADYDSNTQYYLTLNGVVKGNSGKTDLGTIWAPSTLASTGGYILATNAAKTGLEWVAKPATNVTTSAVVSNSATGTTLITAAQTNPYYNLLEGGAVTRSIRFVAGTGITVTSDTSGNITIGCQYAPKIINNSGLPATAADGQYLKWFSTISSTIGGSAGYAGDDTGFPVSNNANGILWLGTHSGPYGHQIGVSSNGELYDRYISNNTFPTTANGGSWKLILNNSNSSVSGGGSTWGSSITVKIGNVSKTLTIPSNPNTNTWRNIYTSGTSRVGTGSDTKAMNFASSNLTINYLAAGTSTGLSGNADYFTIGIEAKNWTGATSSAAGTTGYMPGAASADRFKYLRGDGSWIALAPSISAGTTDTKKIKITVGGENSSEFTIPYATNADTVDGYHADDFLTIGVRNLASINECTERNSGNEYLQLCNPHLIYLIYGVGWYTVSFDIRTDVAGNGNLYSDPGVNPRFRFNSINFNTSTSWEHKVFRINVSDAGSDKTWSAISVYFGYGSGAIVHVKNFKLERSKTESTFSHPEEYFSVYNHTHPLSIATDSGNSQLTLAASTKYKLTAGGSTFIFTTPLNTWRNVYVGGSSKIGTGIDTKAMNFASSNLNITYLAAGTSSGQSGSADYFTIRIDAAANAVGVAGYVAAPTKDANPNQVWMTNADGVPAWRNATASAVLANAANSTTQLTAGQANPFYNLLFGGSVVRSVQFASGEGITVGTTDGSDVKITNVAPVYYIKGNADATAGTWTGTDSRISAYYEGLTIIFVPQIAGASTTTLNINGLGAKTCYFTNTSKLTTHYAVGTPIMLTYYADTWRRADYNSDNNYYSMNVNPRYKVYLDSDSSKSGAIRRYTLIAKCPGKTLTSLTLTENSTASTKTMYSGPLLLDQIYYWNSTVNYSAGANMTTNSVLYDNWSLLDIRYTFNCIGLLTAYQPFYIVLNRRTDGYYQLASIPWLCGEPTEDSETKIYVQLGTVYPDTTPYRISLETVKKYYIRRGGVMLNYYPSSGIVSNNAATIGTSLTTIATVNGVDITAKIGSYASSSHTHYYLVTSGDNRSVVTTPNDYANKLTFVGLKNNTTLGISNAGTYSYLIGLRGWSDNSGGGSHELAFSQGLGLFRRIATDASTWGSWINILDSDNSSVSKSGETLTVKINNTSQSLTNTWRGILNNLTSTSTTDSLSAAQGKALNDKFGSYLPLSGGTMRLGEGLKFHSDNNYFGTDSDARIISLLDGNGTTCDGGLIIDERCTLDETTTVTELLRIRHNEFKWKGQTIYHTGNIPSNSSSAKGVVPAGVASSVYMTDANKNPSWTPIDSIVTSSSSHLVTSGAVFTAITNKVAGAVLYLGTIDSEADMKALSSAGFGDFARVATSFSFTDASGASVTAHVGDIVYMTSNGSKAYATSTNWIVAHTEIDTNTWTAASTSASGYIPKLVTGGANLSAASTDYVLAYVNGTNTPVWRKLPANAYQNTWIAWAGATSDTAGTAGYMPAPTSALRNLFLRGDGTWVSLNNYSLPKATTSALGGIIVSNVLTAAVTLTSANGTTANRYYGVQLDKDGKAFVNIPWVWNAFTAATADAAGTAGYIQAPKGALSKFFRGDNTWLSITSNVTTSLYFGASNGTTNAEVAATPYIILKEGSSYTRYRLEGAGGITVSSDASGNVKFTGTTYSVFTGATANAAGSIGLVKLPAKGDQGKFLRGDCTWQSLTSNVTTALYVGASNGTSTAAQSTNGNVYLILKEGSSYTRYNIVGSGRASVTSDANGKITINSSGYSNFTVATADAAGGAGLVPGPGKNVLGSGGYFLRADATWAVPTNTWKAANNSQEGYVPKLNGNGTIATQSTEYVLTFTSGGSGTITPSWKLLPANAFKNDNTWRNIYTNGTSRIGTGTGTKAINFVQGNNVTITYLAAGTSNGLSGSTDYFGIKIDAVDTWTAWKGATANAAGTAGYMPAPTSAQRGQFLRGDGSWVSLNNYSLPTASNTTLGGVKTGAAITDTTGYTEVAIKNGIIYYKDTNTTYSAATSSTPGLVKIGDTLTDATGYTKVAIKDGIIYYKDTNTTYSAATSSTLGLIKIGDTLTDTTGYTKVAIKDGIAYYKDTNTTYSTATSSALGLVKVGDTISDATGYTACKIKDGVIYYKDTNTTYTFYNLLFQNSSGTTVDTYKPTTSPTKTLKAGSNVTISAASNVITIASTNTWNANAVNVAGYVAAPTKAANANMTWQTDANGNPAWRASNNHSHSYLPLSGANYNTSTDTNPFTISRTGGTSEAMLIMLDDRRTLFKYTNDENASSIVFLLVNTDTERASNKGADASDRNVTISSSNTGISLSVGGTLVSLNGHKHAYTDLTGSGTTANQAIVSNGTANGWTLKTLGSHAFDSTTYATPDTTTTLTRASGNLTKDTWSDVGSFADTVPEGTWVISFTIDGSLYSGVFSRKKSDSMNEEIDLHAAGTSSRRIYARTTGNKIQIATSDATFNPGAVTFNFRKLI